MRGAFIAVAAVLCLPWSAPSAEEGLAVLSATVRFHGARADLRLEGDVTSSRLPSALDPAVDAFRVECAGLALVDLPGDAGASRLTTTGYGDLRVRRRHALDVRLYPGSGCFVLKARGLDAEAFRAAGPSGVEVRVVIGAVETAATIRFTERGRSRWVFRAAPPVRGGGGDGGGPPPGLPPPPPDSTPIEINLLSQGEGSLYPAGGGAWVVARSQTELGILWSKHAPGTPAPQVDFAKEVVAAWFGGDPSNFKTVYVSWAERVNGGIQVHFYLHGYLGLYGHGTHSIIRITRTDGPVFMRAHWSIIGPN